ncbi:hypothetical protein F6X40_35400 [Paraburkholderia sp. UCT31]|uniref:hypothetical protein n=1 Tax=Paraburkholderia sp. UCT31 TaxID=2615209 RepID=UPI0016555ED3|nr:hypothetical protein [Paraburkholderia sp. UCT31]MBC8741837.1 hypothetical protein [Paraburkholderia sp. UCT31]
MRFIKSEVVEFDEKYERARIKKFFSAEEAAPMLAVLDALEAGDLKTASDLLTVGVASRMPAVFNVFKAYRDHLREPDVYLAPKRMVSDEGQN